MKMKMDTWAPDDMGWDHDTGNPGIMLFGNAVQVWAIRQNRPMVTVGQAAKAFKIEPAKVAEAVSAHPWMYLDFTDKPLAEQIIEHDGE